MSMLSDLFHSVNHLIKDRSVWLILPGVSQYYTAAQAAD